jgi:hypothetical protein
MHVKSKHLFSYKEQIQIQTRIKGMKDHCCLQNLIERCVFSIESMEKTLNIDASDIREI